MLRRRAIVNNHVENRHWRLYWPQPGVRADQRLLEQVLGVRGSASVEQEMQHRRLEPPQQFLKALRAPLLRPACEFFIAR